MSAAPIKPNTRTPKCVQCGWHNVKYRGRFCSKACAADYGVSIAQTKRWEVATGTWTPADGVEPSESLAVESAP